MLRTRLHRLAKPGLRSLRCMTSRPVERAAVGGQRTAAPSLIRRFLKSSASVCNDGGGGSEAGGRWAVEKPEHEWRGELSPDQFYVLRQKGTEPPFSGLYDSMYPEESSGHFACAGCNHPLYSAVSKFNSGCGWPAFDKAFDGTVAIDVDESYGMKRIEILCNNCGGHLGHVFTGENHTATNERHCVNSVSITFVSGEKHEAANVPEGESAVAKGL